MELLYQGAEAKLYQLTMMDRSCIAKERFVKCYRHESMDLLLRSQRTKAEARALLRAAQLEVSVPALYFLDLKNFILYMEKINGVVLKSLLVEYVNKPEYAEYLLSVMKLLGANVARLHLGGLIHGDLTTSNFVVRNASLENKEASSTISQKNLVTIDFGLSFVSEKAEDKAVDMYVLERALLSTHPDMMDELFFNGILSGYRQINASHAAEVIGKLEEVRLRGRKRLMIG